MCVITSYHLEAMRRPPGALTSSQGRGGGARCPARPARLCRWRAAEHARKLRDRCVTQRAGPAPRAVRADSLPRPRSHVSQNTSIFAWLVILRRPGWQRGSRAPAEPWSGVLVRGAGATCVEGEARGRGGRAARAAVARKQAGDARRPALSRCTAATRGQVRAATVHLPGAHCTALRPRTCTFHSPLVSFPRFYSSILVRILVAACLSCT